MTVILQTSLPFAPWMDARTARLPGVLPLEDDGWIIRDDAFAGQMALRDGLITDKSDTVLALRPEGRPAADELFGHVLALLATDPGYQIGPDAVKRPDGAVVALDRSQPMATLGRLVQEDLCLMERHAPSDEHVLTGACLCFPASWSLQEKIGRPLTGIHRTVKPYDAELARRVQRMFDVIRPGAPLWRMNALVYVDPSLHQPGVEQAPRTERRGGRYLRAERQVFLRLPHSQAVLFAIHTYVVALDTLTEAERSGLNLARL